MSKIVRCGIYPSIGIARVGNSPRGFFVGPEVPAQVPLPRGGRKDAAGRIKRQVARFRIYGYDASGNVVQELTAADADIEWTVHVANHKASWYAFQRALDLADSVPTPRRNAEFGGSRRMLEIDPGPRTIAGTRQRQELDGGSFLGREVSLGEIRTDSAGRLLLFGGLGDSGSPIQAPITGLNNDGWYDDCSDGPVTARVRLAGRSVPLDPAWVVVAPPDFAPGVVSPVTMLDIQRQVAFDQGWLAKPSRISFVRDVLPTLHRICDLQWVNEGFNLFYGWGSKLHFDALVEELSDPRPAAQPMRRHVFELFRPPHYRQSDPFQLPPMYGDGVHAPISAPVAEKWLTVTPYQYECLRAWARGEFTADWHADWRVPSRLSEIPLQERPQALTSGALEPCLGGAFHPGCEMTWPTRQALVYASAFRFKRRQEPEPQGWGAKLSRRRALAPGGPLDGLVPGGMTRWMQVPWQVDTASCRSGYQPALSSYLPTFWPARVPNQVLTARQFQLAQELALPLRERTKHFEAREEWLRDFPLSLGSVAHAEKFLAHWHEVGIVSKRRWPHDEAEFPREVHVEEGNGFDEPSR